MTDSLYYTVKHKELSEKSNAAAVLARLGNTIFAVEANISLIEAHIPDMNSEDRERAENTIKKIISGKQRYDGSRFQSNILVR